MLQSDVERYRALQAGKKSALGQLYDRYATLVYSLALKILTNPQEAEDLTQEIFLTLWHRQTYNPDRGSLSSFLITLTRSRALDRLRSRSSKHRLISRCGQMISTSAPLSTPVELASVQERQELVRKALEQLPQKHRQVLEMAYYQGLSQSEIAKQLNKPLGTVKTWARKGLLQLRNNLQEFIGERDDG